MNAPLQPGEVRVETINISDAGIALIILDGQLAESERYLMTLSRRRARLLAELRELDDQITGSSKATSAPRPRSATPDGPLRNATPSPMT